MKKELRFLVALLVSGILAWVTFLAYDSFSLNHLKLISDILRSDAEIMIFGNSINKAYSTCDTAFPGIGELLSAELGTDVLDASMDGLSPQDQSSLAKLAARYSSAKFIVLPVYINSFGNVPKRDLFLRDAVLSLLSASFPESTPSFNTSVERDRENSEHNTRYHAAIAEAGENGNQNACEEQHVFDNPEIRAISSIKLSRIYADVKTASNPEYFINTIGKIREAGIEPIVYLTPQDVEAQRLLTSSDNEDAMLNIQIKNIFKKNGVDFLDLSESLPTENFTERWCVCGHLDYDGKLYVARAIAEKISSIKAKPEGALSFMPLDHKAFDNAQTGTLWRTIAANVLNKKL